MSDATRTVWLCRHGNRQDFVDPLWLDTADRPHDPPLSDDGHEQAQTLARSFAGNHVDHLFCSPFLGCLQTARPVADALDKPMHVENGLGELHYEDWFLDQPDLLPVEAMRRQFPRVSADHRSMIQPQYPESEDDAWRRTSHTMQLLLGAYDGNLLFIAHAGSIMGMTMALTIEKPDIWVGLCCRITLVEDRGRWTLTDNGFESADRSAARWV